MQKTSDLVAIIFFLSIVNIVFEPYLKQYSYIDETLVFLLILLLLKRIRLYIKLKEFRIYIVVIFALLAYSLARRVNVPQAIVRDFFIFLKPFVCFYIAYLGGASFSTRMKNFCKIGFCLLSLYLWYILPNIGRIYYNTTAYYPACVFVGVGYLFCSKRSMNDWLIATIMLFPGLASIRAKFFAEFIMWLSIIFFIKGKVKINIKYLIIGLVVFAIAYHVNQNKIYEYIIHGMRDDKARAILYYTAILIIKDFFPLGSGFGTFATDSAARFYSPLNYRYHLNHVWGLSPEDIARGYNYYSDTFYPILAQFGVVGIFFFFWFCYRRWQEGKMIESLSQYKIFLFMYSYIAIQCIAENTFTSQSCIPIMLIIGMSLSRNRST